MDISFWTKSNPDIRVCDTTKKYFGKYLYKLVVYAPAGRVIDSKHTVADAIMLRRELRKSLMTYGTFYALNRSDDTQADEAFLEMLKTLRHDDTIKMRIEEPMIQIYANNEKHLKDIVKKFKKFPKQYLDSISGPKNAQLESVLNSGAIIRKTDNGFKYKVIVRDGRYDTMTKQALLNYLLNLGADNAQISKNSIDTLKRNSSFIWGLYFYVNDLSTLTFVNLIHPNLILNHHEIVVP